MFPGIQSGEQNQQSWEPEQESIRGDDQDINQKQATSANTIGNILSP